MYRGPSDYRNIPCTSAESREIVENYSKLLGIVKLQEEILKQQYSEIPLILDEWQRCKQKLQIEATAHMKLKDEHKNLMDDIASERREMDALRASLRDARAISELDKKENDLLREELKQTQGRLKQIRGIMTDHFPGFSDEVKTKLSFLCDSGTGSTAATRSRQDDDTLDDLDYDESVDSQDILADTSSRFAHPLKRENQIRKPQDLNEAIPPKRVRNEKVIPVTLDYSMSLEQSPICTGYRTDQMTPVAVKNLMALNNERSTRVAELRTPLRPTASSRWLRSSTIESRKHTLEKLPTKLKVTSCAVCHGAISIVGRPAKKCRDCHQHIHVQCKLRLPLPCIPRTITPTKTPSKNRPGIVRYRLQDYCPSSSPMIAWPVVHCVVQLETRGMADEKIYRTSGKRVTTNNILNEFRTSRSIPKLDNVELESIADVIKRFLSDLRDPLIPKTSRQEFITAVINDQRSALNNAIFDLPQANRDTLAYLILHWQKLAAHEGDNNLSIESIAKSVGLVVMGQNTTDTHAATQVARYCERVLIALLSISEEYWKGYLYSNLEADQSSTPSGRRSLRRSSRFGYRNAYSSANCSLLGPINTPPHGAVLVREPLTPAAFFPDPCE